MLFKIDPDVYCFYTCQRIQEQFVIFRKKRTWYWPAFKALAFCWLLYRMAKGFLKAVSKQNPPPGKKSKENLSLIESVRKLLNQK